MANVCILISGYPRDNARVFQRQAKSLLSFGFNVSILTNDGGVEECVDGINIYCTDFWQNRLKILLFAGMQFLRKAIKVNADIYFIHSPELLSLGLLLKLRGKKVIYDAHEDLPNHILEKEWLPSFLRPPISIICRFYFDFVFSKIDALISPHCHVISKYQSINPNCVLITNFAKTITRDEFSLPEYLGRRKVICYSGTCYFHSNQIQILEAIKDQEDAVYSIAGTIPEKLYTEMKTHRSFPKVEFLGLIDFKMLKDFYSKSRIGIVVIDYKLNLGGKRGTYAVNKIFEYMEAGLPIICSDYDLWINVVDRYSCGIYVRPGNVTEIRDAISYLLDNPAAAYQMGQNGLFAIRNEYNWKFEEAKLHELFLKLKK
jgi:glycosyltransferase involved in cell wall biosynthesis